MPVTTCQLAGPAGKLFSTLYLPGRDDLPARWVVHVPAFCEEMNKSRPMVAAAARGMAAKGWHVLVPDLHGTGDSEGEFSKASWSTWRDEIVYLVNTLRAANAVEVRLWGLRLGCLLALDAAALLGQSVQSLILWQPVTSGAQYLKQFLRLRVAARRMRGLDESVSQLMAKLDAGDSVRVAGYTLPSRMALELAALEMPAMAPGAGQQVHWLSVRNTGGGCTPVEQKVIAAWQAAGVGVEAESLPGESFWATTEISMAPELVQRTAELCPPATAASAGNGPIIPGGVACSDEQGVAFQCDGDTLLGVIHRPPRGIERGVLIVVGGPQYRVGAHRQFVNLARHLAAAGIPAMRFDYRGMGDSEGNFRGFQHVSRDIGAAMDEFFARLPQMKSVVLWGLCDGATAAACYAVDDRRVSGLALANPWVHSEQGQARAFIRHYYTARLFNRGFWRRLLRGEVGVVQSLKSLLANFLRSRRPGGAQRQTQAPETSPRGQALESAGISDDLVGAMEDALVRFPGKLLLLLSGRDLTAAEFADALGRSRRLRKVMASDRARRCDFAEADHTFAASASENSANEATANWVRAL
ncbi:hydrolase 1, exosortase A system-associated [Parahaliea mediterranea]|uniref:Hydrolase 1, exosortase A system-associated n=1 Tax=Parahaliea mediterranea TaxID=651086 RepID=A0A939DG42_9GAMM|nr:hydrolase 1, exosortase A system-associated [Parahaliea mediterranea]MBN7797424.1 hydrolase 1, exosortase A system-associated [Parahaliea mediterranea]